MNVGTIGLILTIVGTAMFLFFAMAFPDGEGLVGAIVGIFVLFVGIVLLLIEKIRTKKDKKINNTKSKFKKESEGNLSLEILKKRYASGEISEDEFKKIKENLE